MECTTYYTMYCTMYCTVMHHVLRHVMHYVMHYVLHHVLQALLHDEEMTEFAIVTIPTGLAIAESERLLLALQVGFVSRR